MSEEQSPYGVTYPNVNRVKIKNKPVNLVLCRKRYWGNLVSAIVSEGTLLQEVTSDRVTTSHANVFRGDRRDDIVGNTFDEVWVFGLWKASDLIPLLEYALQSKKPN